MMSKIYLERLWYPKLFGFMCIFRLWKYCVGMCWVSVLGVYQILLDYKKKRLQGDVIVIWLEIINILYFGF